MRAIAASASVLLLCAAAPAGDDPRVTHACMVSPEVVAITIAAGRVEYGRQVPYAKQPGDKVERKGKSRWVRRDGKFIGSVLNKKKYYIPEFIYRRV